MLTYSVAILQWVWWSVENKEGSGQENRRDHFCCAGAFNFVMSIYYSLVAIKLFSVWLGIFIAIFLICFQSGANKLTTFVTEVLRDILYYVMYFAIFQNLQLNNCPLQHCVKTGLFCFFNCLDILTLSASCAGIRLIAGACTKDLNWWRSSGWV